MSAATLVKKIYSSVSFFNKERFIYYLHNGSPIFCHHADSTNNYRYLLANLLESKLCHASEISRALGINQRNVERYAKKLREQGDRKFF